MKRDEEEDDYTIIDDPFKSKGNAVKRIHPPTPPRTPLMEDLELQRPSGPQSSTSMTPVPRDVDVDNDSDSDYIDEDDDIPLSVLWRSSSQKTGKERRCSQKHDSEATTLVTDPAKREAMLRTRVRPHARRSFETLERKFIQWSEKGFKGSLKDFWSRTGAEVS
jgi:hypothetical protein